MLIIALKIAALITIKIIWFSDAPEVAPTDIARNLLSPATQAQQGHTDQR